LSVPVLINVRFAAVFRLAMCPPSDVLYEFRFTPKTVAATAPQLIDALRWAATKSLKTSFGWIAIAGRRHACMLSSDASKDHSTGDAPEIGRKIIPIEIPEVTPQSPVSIHRGLDAATPVPSKLGHGVVVDQARGDAFDVGVCAD
jgi:hypothetical protein